MQQFQLSSAGFGTSCQRPKPQANVFWFFLLIFAVFYLCQPIEQNQMQLKLCKELGYILLACCKLLSHTSVMCRQHQDRGSAAGRWRTLLSSCLWPVFLWMGCFLCAVGLPVRVRMLVPFPSDVGMARTKRRGWLNKKGNLFIERGVCSLLQHTASLTIA